MILDSEHFPLGPDLFYRIAFTAKTFVIPFAINQGEIKSQTSTYPTVVARKEFNIFSVFAISGGVISATGTKKFFCFSIIRWSRIVKAS
jgi:hypothetical protein